MSQKIEKINFNDIISEYEVKNIEGFSIYLKQVWKDLCSRKKDDKNKEGIDKITFQKYYDLPGLISERLFSIFDSSRTGCLSLNDFIYNMQILFSSNLEKLLEFIFKFYDFDNDGKITKEDVRVVLSYVPIYKKIENDNCLKFEVDNFEDRLNSQKELHSKLGEIFGAKEKLNLEEFISVIKTQNSDMFLFILIFLYEYRPFSVETIKYLENIKRSPMISTRKIYNLIASPNLNSNLIVSKTLQKSPAMNGFSISDRIKNPNINTKMKFLGILSGEKIEKEKQIKDNNPLNNFFEIIPESKEENQKNITNGDNFIKPKRKILKYFSLNDKKIKNLLFEEKLKKDEDIVFPFGKHLEGGNLPNNKENNKIESIKENENTKDNNEEKSNDNNNDNKEDNKKNNEIVDGYLYKIQENKIKKIYFKLICKDLYYYKSKENKKHKGMHNLSGAYIKDEGPVKIKERKLFCFNIIFPGKEKRYYVSNEKEYNKWIEAIRKIVHYSNFHELYDIRETLGKGKFGLVKLGIHKETGRKVAVKIINKQIVDDIDIQQVKSEIDILKIAKHPNIIKLYDVFENEHFIFIIMEYCPGGDLFFYIEKRGFKLKEYFAAQIIYKLCTSLFFLHQYGIVHRDLKPENILMTDKTDNADIRLVDFGLGKIIGPGEECNEPFGTFSYVAPEILLGKTYNFKVDMFGIGIIAYLLLAGFLPFDDENSEKEIARQTVYEPTPFPPEIWKTISKEAKSFVENLLDKNPDKRMNIKEALEHKWIQKYSNENKVIF